MSATASRVRIAATALCTIVLAIGVALFGVSAPAQATGCRVGGLVCGVVENWSSHKMLVTDDLDYSSLPYSAPKRISKNPRLPNLCQLWNPAGDSNRHKSKPVQCRQLPLAPGKSTLGHDADIDAFTFANHDYKIGYVGSLANKRLHIKKGVWTRIRSGQKVDCYNMGGQIYCLTMFMG